MPQDVAIIGFNDLDFTTAAVPPLSTVSTERRQMGTWAAQTILEIIRGPGRRPDQIRVDVGFSIKRRGSTDVMHEAKAARVHARDRRTIGP